MMALEGMMRGAPWGRGRVRRGGRYFRELRSISPAAEARRRIPIPRKQTDSHPTRKFLNGRTAASTMPSAVAPPAGPARCRPAPRGRVRQGRQLVARSPTADTRYGKDLPHAELSELSDKAVVL